VEQPPAVKGIETHGSIRQVLGDLHRGNNRQLNPGQEALLVLAYLRKGETFDELAAGFGVGRTTAWRYVNEVTELLAARAPKLRQAVRDAKRAGHAYVILDGTLIPIGRVARGTLHTRRCHHRAWRPLAWADL
jgi:hypothetical protein